MEIKESRGSFFRKNNDFNKDNSSESFREERSENKNNYSRERSFSNRRDDNNSERPRRSFNPNFSRDNKFVGGNSEHQNRSSFGDDDNGRRGIKRDRSYKFNDSDSTSKFEHRRFGNNNRRFENDTNTENQSSTGERKPYGERRSFDRKPYGERSEGRSFERKPYGERSEGGERRSFDRKPYGERSERGGFERKPYGERSEGGERRSFDRKPYGERSERGSFERKPYRERSEGGERRSFDRKPYGERSERGGFERKPYGERGGFERKPYGDRNERGGFERKSFNRSEDTQSQEPESNFTNVLTELRKGEIRLNRYVAMSGICSRREADELITSGRVSVNDVVVTEMGSRVTIDDIVKFDDKIIRGEKNVYILMNKPKDYVTTLEDKNCKYIVTDLLKDEVPERVYPVGRLDKNSVGVLLMTNDGELTKILTHPSYNKKKIYHVFIDKDINDEDMQKLATGIELEDGITFVDEISCVEGSRREVGVEIHSGKNRIVRRMFESLGYKVRKLDRVYFAGLTKKGLQRGEWRHLSSKEVEELKRMK